MHLDPALPASDIYLARRLEQVWALTESVTTDFENALFARLEP